MAGQKAVADAAVVAKWFLEEEFSDKAVALRDALVTGELIIAVPSLLPYEVLNALRFSGIYDGEELSRIAGAISKYGLERWEPEGRLLEETAKVSARHDLSVYDAAYVALAIFLKAKFYTTDEELIKKFPGQALHIEAFRK